MPRRNRKPLLRVLQGESLWPPPIWLMRQAGRYLPEYRAIRSQAVDFITLCTSPALASEVTLQPIRRFGFDAAILFSDILLLPWALGHGLDYREGEGPVLPPLRDTSALAALDRHRAPAVLAPISDTIRRVAAALAAEHPGTALIGFAGAPFTVACYIIEGHGSKDFAATRALAYREPSLIEGLIDLLSAATIDFLMAQVEAGADALMLFDSWAGILPPTQFRQFVIEPTRRVVGAVKDRFPEIPIIGFPRMAALMLGEYTANTQLSGIGIDTAADPALAACMLPGHVALQGNLDPMALVAGQDAMRRQTHMILEAMRGRPFVFNLGHGILPQTPPEHVAELVRLVRAG